MATKKTTTIKKSSVTVNGSDSTSIIDVIKVYGNGNTVNARKGDDWIGIYTGKNNKIYAGAGVDTVAIANNAGTENKIYGEGGNDIIKINGSNNNYFDSGSGQDSILIKGGSKNEIHGGSGVDTITVYATAGKANHIYGDSSGDVFNINGGTNYIYGGTGGDKITVKGGTGNKIYGQSGNDKIYIYTGKQGVDAGTGSDTIEVSGGNNHVLRGGKGSDTYILSSGISNETTLNIMQKDYVAGDTDVLKLTSAKRADISFGYDGEANILTATHTTGGKVSVQSWTVNPLKQVYFANDESVSIIAGNNNKTIKGTSGNDYIIAGTANTTVAAGAGNDTVVVSGGSKSIISGGGGEDMISVTGDTSLKINGDGSADKIYIKGGSGHEINSGTGKDSIYVYSGAHTINNEGGNDYIEIKKGAGNKVKIESGANSGYKLVANETVKVLGGNNHDIKLYGGNDKVIVAGGSGHVVYTDGPTGSGDAGDNDVIVIQSGGQAERIVAGNGNDVIAIANGAGNGSTIYTGLENPNNVNTGTGVNTVNILGGSGHTLYLGGTENKVLIEAQNVTLNKYAGTADDIRVRWSEQGTGTLRINCPSVSSSKESTLRIEGANSWQFKFYKQSVDIKNANGVVSETVDALVMKFVGQYQRDTRTVSGSYQWTGDNDGNTLLPVYINGDGRVQYNWCAGNEQISYNSTPVATGGSIEITRWNSDATRVFDSITFDDGSFGYSAINIATTRDTRSIALG